MHPLKFIEGDVVCAHGDTVLYCLANLKMKVDGQMFEVKSEPYQCQSPKRDILDLKQLIGAPSSLTQKQ